MVEGDVIKEIYAIAYKQMLAIIFMRIFYFILFLSISIQLYSQTSSQWQLYQDSLNYFLKQKDLTKCIVYHDKLIALYPNSTHSILTKGAFLYNVKECKAAIKEFTKALSINNKITDALVRRGKSYLCLHKYDSGILDFSSALGKYRYQDSTIFLYRSYAYNLIGKQTNAKLDYDSALRFHKSVKELHHSFGLVKYEMQDLAGAISEFNMAVQIDKNYFPSIKARAISNFDLGRVQESFRDSQLYLSYFPNDIDLNYIIAVYFFEQKDYKSALRHIEKCKANLKTKGMYYLSGMINYYLVNDKEAINDLTIALKLNPTGEEEGLFYYTIGLCKNNIKPKSGCKEILKAIQKGSEDAKRNYSVECK